MAGFRILPSRRRSARKSPRPRLAARRCRIEPLEARMVLSVISPPDVPGVIGFEPLPAPQPPLQLDLQELPGTFTDLGVVDFLDLDIPQGSAGEHWYRLEAVRDGMLTVAGHPSMAGGVRPGDDPFSITLFALVGDGSLVEVVRSPSRIDYDAAAAAQEYYLLLTTGDDASQWKLGNLVQVDEEAGQVRVYGSQEADEIAFLAYPVFAGWLPAQPIGEAGPFCLVNVNGLSYVIGESFREDIYIEAGEEDHLTLGGDNGGEDHFQLGGFVYPASLGAMPLDGRFSGEWGTVSFSGGPMVEVNGYGGNDSANLYSSPSWTDTTLIAAPAETLLSWSGGEYRLTGFESVDAWLPTGNGSRAEVHGSAGDDSVVATRWDVTLTGEDYSIEVSTGIIDVYGGGGDDTAQFWDSPWDDVFTAGPGKATMTYSNGKAVSVYDCPLVHVTSQGGDDAAYLYDSAGDDRFYATPTRAKLELDGGYEVIVDNSRYVHAYATAGGEDVAFLYGAGGDDTFLATPVYGKMYGDGYMNRAKHFEYVHAYGGDGHDTAVLIGSPGDDEAIRKDDYTKLYGDGFFLRAKYFEETSVHGGGGDDKVWLRDSTLDDLLAAEDNWAQLSNDAWLVKLLDFATVHACSHRGGHDVAEIAEPLEFTLHLYGDWSQ